MALRPHVFGSVLLAVSVGCGDSGTKLEQTRPLISINPAALDFGAVPVGATRYLTLEIKNPGTATLHLSALALTGPFGTLEEAPLEVAAGSARALSVAFTPKSLEAAVGALSIRSDGEGSPELSVALSGSGAPLDIEVSPLSIDYRDAQIGWSRAERLVIKNLRATAVDTAIRGLSFSRPSHFALSGSSPVADRTPLSIAAGQTQELSVGYLAKARGADRGLLLVETCGDRCGVTVQLLGRVLAQDLSVQPESVDFDSLRPGEHKDQIVRVINRGDAPVDIDSITLSSGQPFTLASPALPLTLAPEAGVTLELSYRPTALGAHRSEVVVRARDPLQAPLLIPLRGVAESPALASAPTRIDFGTVPKDQQARRPLVVTNVSPVAVSITALSVAGDPAFSTSGASLPLRLGAGESFTAYLEMRSALEGVLTATVSIGTDDPLIALQVPAVALVGQPRCNLVAAPMRVDFGTTTGSAATSLAFTQTGSASCQILEAGLELGGPFEATSPQTPVTLAPGDRFEVQLRYVPLVEGYDRARFALRTDDPLRRRTVILIAASFARPGTELPPPPPPEEGVCMLTALPNRIDFGASPGTAEFFLSQIGQTDCVLNESGFDGAHVGFTAEPPHWPITLRPGEHLPVRLRFSPTSMGQYTARYWVRSAFSPRQTMWVSLFGDTNVICTGQTAYGTCACEGDSVLALSPFAPRGSGFFENSSHESPYSASCVPNAEPCRSDQIVLIEAMGMTRCVSAPPVCSNGQVALYGDGGWDCAECPYIIQYGGIFDGERVCGEPPDLRCGSGETPTFVAEDRAWSCRETCNNGLYDQILVDQLLICVPC